MSNLVNRFIHEEEGMGVIEVVIIIAILVAVALIFKQGIFDFVNNLMKEFFKKPTIPADGTDYKDIGNQ